MYLAHITYILFSGLVEQYVTGFRILLHIWCQTIKLFNTACFNFLQDQIEQHIINGVFLLSSAIQTNIFKFTKRYLSDTDWYETHFNGGPSILSYEDCPHSLKYSKTCLLRSLFWETTCHLRSIFTAIYWISDFTFLDFPFGQTPVIHDQFSVEFSVAVKDRFYCTVTCQAKRGLYLFMSNLHLQCRRRIAARIRGSWRYWYNGLGLVHCHSGSLRLWGHTSALDSWHHQTKIL